MTIHVDRSHTSFKVVVEGQTMIESREPERLDALLEIFKAFELRVFVYDDPGYDVSDL